MTQPRKSWAVQRASKTNRTEAAGGSRVNGAAPHSFDLTVGPRVPHCNFRVDDGSTTWRVSVVIALDPVVFGFQSYLPSHATHGRVQTPLP